MFLQTVKSEKNQRTHGTCINNDYTNGGIAFKTQN